MHSSSCWQAPVRAENSLQQDIKQPQTSLGTSLGKHCNLPQRQNYLVQHALPLLLQAMVVAAKSQLTIFFRKRLIHAFLHRRCRDVTSMSREQVTEGLPQLLLL